MIVALVTGTEIEVSRRLADRDAEVIVTAPDEAGAQEAAELLWSEGLDTVHPRAVDVASDASVVRLCDSVARDFGALHVLVHGAGDEGRLARVFESLLASSGGRVISADGRAVDEIVADALG